PPQGFPHDVGVDRRCDCCTWTAAMTRAARLAFLPFLLLIALASASAHAHEVQVGSVLVTEEPIGRAMHNTTFMPNEMRPHAFRAILQNRRRGVLVGVGIWRLLERIPLAHPTRVVMVDHDKVAVGFMRRLVSSFEHLTDHQWLEHVTGWAFVRQEDD